MSKLQAIQVDEDTIIYVEATENAIAPAVSTEPEEVQRGGAKGMNGRGIENQMAQSFKAIESTIRTYTKYTLNAFKDAALADVEKVTLEFGMNVSGAGGVPYIAAGTVGCNIKITVECGFPNQRQAAQTTTQTATQTAPRSAQPAQSRPGVPSIPAQPAVSSANSVRQ